MFEARLLDPASAPAFARMTYTAERPLLLGQEPGAIAIGLWNGGEPAGLALAKPSIAPGESGKVAELVSLFIARELWGQGLGTEMLGLMETQLGERGFVKVGANHNSNGQCTAAWERVLAKRGWSAAIPTLVHVELENLPIAQADWVVETRVPAGYEIFPWGKLTPLEWERVVAMQDEVPPALRCTQQTPQPLDPELSLGLRCGEEVVGWVLAHTIKPGLRRCTIEYVLERWRTPQASYGLMAAFLRGALPAAGPARVVALAVSVQNEPMLRMIRRRILPYARTQYELRSSWKALTM
jgi:GNAT superfamily N-acetyltransferase